MIASIKAYAWQVVSVALGLSSLALATALLAQTLRLHEAEIGKAEAKLALSTYIGKQAKQSQAATEKKAGDIIAHATDQQENTHDYTQKLAALAASRAADAGRIASLRDDIRSAATRNAQLASDAAACRDLADQHQRLASIAGEGAGVVGELVGLVKVRDAQVNALQGQVGFDGVLLGR